MSKTPDYKGHQIRVNRLEAWCAWIDGTRHITGQRSAKAAEASARWLIDNQPDLFEKLTP
jgi:hypothetical protein